MEGIYLGLEEDGRRVFVVRSPSGHPEESSVTEQDVMALPVLEFYTAVQQLVFQPCAVEGD